jgi:hypothetical protein
MLSILWFHSLGAEGGGELFYGDVLSRGDPISPNVYSKSQRNVYEQNLYLYLTLNTRYREGVDGAVVAAWS